MSYVNLNQDIQMEILENQDPVKDELGDRGKIKLIFKNKSTEINFVKNIGNFESQLQDISEDVIQEGEDRFEDKDVNSMVHID
jgi:hypothetical protein